MKGKSRLFHFVSEISLLIIVLIILNFGFRLIQSKESASQTYPLPGEGLRAQTYPSPIAGLPVQITDASVEYPLPELPRPTPIILTVEPTLTNPPASTRASTPVITPMPASKPPFIPEAVGKAPKPFWVIYWDRNQVWRIDDQGKEQDLLIDTYQELGQWLTAYPIPGSDCCYVGKRVVASPDEQKLALVTLDKEKITQKGEPFHFSIYVFDIRSNKADFVDYGIHPAWSPDGSQIAYIKQNEVWLYRLDTGEKKILIAADQSALEANLDSVEWSPDGKSLLLTTNQSAGVDVALWLFDIHGDETPELLLPSNLYSRGGFSWGPDGQAIYYLSPEGMSSGSEMGENLWSISTLDGKRTQLTRDMTVSSWSWSPYGKWLAISATKHYEYENYPYDIWLLNTEKSTLIRVTSDQLDDSFSYWSPGGNRLIFWREGVGVVALSLESGEIQPLGIIPDVNNFLVGSVK